jgi:molybdate transport system ATP-binding protein
MTLRIDITHSLGGFTLDTCFEAGPGVTAIFGRSGAGKTTLINAVAGVIAPDSGRITFGDDTLFDVRTNVPPHKRQMGYVFQDARLFPHMSVAKNLDYAVRFAAQRPQGAPRNDVIELLGLGPLLSRAPHDLSGGEKQRVALGRALLSRPRALLMDEPLAALDAARKDAILPYLERLKSTAPALPILYVSHALDEVARLADNIVVLSQGKVAAQGPIFDVLSDPNAVPLLGVRQAGAVVCATVVDHGTEGLSTLRTSAGTLTLPGVQAAIGSTVRLRILAQDVILSPRKPEGLSTANVLPVTVTTIKTGIGPGAAVGLLAGTDRVLARIPAPAIKDLDIKPGTSCYALINATSVAPSSIGR